MSTPAISVTHDAARRTFFTPDGAHLDYDLRDGRAAFVHTFVPPELRGQGHAAALTRAALAQARHAGWQVVPVCSYVQVFLRRNPEFASARLADGRPAVQADAG